MSVSITEQLQEANPEVAFADVKQNFSNPNELVNKLQPSLPELNYEQFKIDSFDLSSLDNAVAEVPVSNNELQTEVSGKINQLNSINIETLSAAIPESPSADNFQDITVGNEIQNNITNLTKDLVGDLSIGEVSKAETTSAGGEEIFGEFNQFVTNAGRLPVRTLDALLKAFKKFLDKLSDPEQLLEQLGSEALTNIFSEQIQSLKAQIPSEAIRIIANNIELRQKEIIKYNDKVNQLKELIGKFDSIDSNKNLITEEVTTLKSDIKTIRLEVKEIANTLEKLDQSTAESLENLRTFNIDDFPAKLEGLKQVNSDAIVLQPLFDQINQYIDTIKAKIASITENLKNFTQKIPKLIDEGINKVESIATNIAGTISEKIKQGKEVLTKLKDYLSEIIKKIRDFIQNTADKSSELIKPFKEISNKASTTVVGKIDEVSGKIKDATKKLETSIGDVNQKIEDNLNKEQLIKKIGDFLDQVTAILDGEAVKNALLTAENGIQTITTNLDKVTLEPAFQTVVNKSSDLETKLKEVDVSKLSTPSKAALKVGTEVIKQVDVPGTVTPELQAAFAEILDPLENIIGLIQGEFQKIDGKIESFTPGTLVENFLSPYLNPVIDKLEEYKPSVLLKPVKNFYDNLWQKMEVINPSQLLEKLEELYLKLVDVIESLSPEKITNFLKEQLSNIQQQLDELPVETLVQKIKDGLGKIDKVMASLGLGDVLKSDFWQTLQDILSFNFTEKIKEIENIRDKVTDKLGDVDDKKLTGQLEGLKEAIATYVDKPNTATDINIVTTANTNYQNETNNLLNSEEVLKDITPPREVIVDYRDLKKRLENLYENFTATRPELPQQKLPQQIVEKLANIVQSQQQDLKGDENSRKELKEKSNEILNSQLIEEFKKVIPDEINRQIINPIKVILEKLDEILKQPRAILDDIEKVIKKIAKAPGEIAEILAKVTDKLAKDIRVAIDSLKKVISDLTNEVTKTLEETHQIIVETVKKLNPRRLLHIFDESDFEKLNLLIQKIKHFTPNDKVSEYINSKLSANPQFLLSKPDSKAAKNAIINDLNNLVLTDANFYNTEGFESIKLTAQGDKLRQEIQELKQEIQELDPKNQELKKKIDKYESDIIFFNRLLLEAYYNIPEEIIINKNTVNSPTPDIFVKSDFENLDLLIHKINQPAKDDKVSEYIKSKLSAKTKSLLVDSTSDATKDAIINDLNILLTNANFYNSEGFESIKLTAQGEELRQKTDKDESEIIFLNRLLLNAYYNIPVSRIIKMNIESIFPYLKEKLAEIYPDEVVKKLDELHQKIIQLLRDIPQAIGEALDQKYQEKIVQKTQALRQQIDNLFKALRDKLEALKSELDIGLEDVGDAFDRLINAIPV